MHLLLKQHKLLKILFENFIEYEKKNKKNVHVAFTELFEIFNCEKEQLHLLTGKLFTEDEIGFSNVNFDGLYIKPKGITAYANKTYLKDKENKFFDKSKNWVQLLVPVLSLLLAGAIFLKSNSKLREQDQELQAIKERVQLLEKYRQPTVGSEIKANDSLPK